MKATLEIDLDDFYEYGEGELLKDRLIHEMVNTMVLKAYESQIDSDYVYGEIKAGIDKILKDNQEQIIESVISRVANKISRKKKIIAETPSAAKLAAIDKENEEYFIYLIDKAIAKRFK